MQEVESSNHTNRLFYLAIPPSIFIDTAHAIGSAGFVQCDGDTPWSRVVVEKPFGKDRKTSDDLISSLADVFSEIQTYRIDHYLGKEVVQNLLALRFANLVFEPIWNSKFIESVSICWRENLGVEGRGGYFDEYGIIRDVVQNHLIQILSLIAMDPPADLTPSSIAKEKTKVLSSIPPIELDDIILGQYTEGTLGSRNVEAYTADDTVPDDSRTPTFASTVLRIENERWKGVPFKIMAGKGLNKSLTEIHIKFKAVANNIFCKTDQCPEPNELIIRVQPDEAIYLKLTSKVPGPGMKLDARNLDLQYKVAFNEIIADAYESLILDVIKGDRSLFITKGELETAWDIFTPLLHK
ncbi:glucose-6-phosphate dehydrogenase, partial [bacterium B17]